MSFRNKISTSIANNLFELTILPTEICNFRCVYCYEDFKIGHMASSVVQGIKNLIKNRIAELGLLKIEWFGGEPLANLARVLEITSYAKKSANSTNCKFHSGMTTNEYLLSSKVFHQVIDAGVTSFQISLDGPEQHHNKTRLRADGAGTFARIWQNLENMASTSHKFSVMLRVHITPENYKAIPELIGKINKRFAGDNRFAVFLKAVSDLGGPNTGKISVLNKQNLADIMQKLQSQVQINLIKELKEESFICYAAKANSLIIRANGRIAKCTIVFNDDRNDIGYITEEGFLMLDQQKLQPWVRGLISQDKKALACPLQKLPSTATQFNAKSNDIIQAVNL